MKSAFVRTHQLVDSVIITWKIIKQYLRASLKTKNSHGYASIKYIPFRCYTYSPQFRQIALFVWLCVAESDNKVEAWGVKDVRSVEERQGGDMFSHNANLEWFPIDHLSCALLDQNEREC